MNHKQAAKRRWKATRDAKAKWMRESRRSYRSTTIRIKTHWGTLHTRTHPLLQTIDRTAGTWPTQPGYYDLTRKAS